MYTTLRFVGCAAMTFLIGLGMVTAVNAVPITVRVENLTTGGGLYFTPMWVGFHDGSFDVFDAGVATTPGAGLENLAEDGDFSVLSGEFLASPAGAAGGVDGAILAPDGFAGAPVFDPGDMGTATFDLDPGRNRYFSYASMVIPSNDAFIGNENPMAVELFDSDGKFRGPITVEIRGANVWDAGTEANTETEAAFFDQTAPNSGTTTGDPVASHVGFIGSLGNPGGTARILGGTSTAPPGISFDSVAADFTASQFALARITVVPEPSTGALLALALACCLPGFARRRLCQIRL